MSVKLDNHVNINIQSNASVQNSQTYLVPAGRVTFPCMMKHSPLKEKMDPFLSFHMRHCSSDCRPDSYYIQTTLNLEKQRSDVT